MTPLGLTVVELVLIAVVGFVVPLAVARLPRWAVTALGGGAVWLAWSSWASGAMSDRQAIFAAVVFGSIGLAPPQALRALPWLMIALVAVLAASGVTPAEARSWVQA